MKMNFKIYPVPAKNHIIIETSVANQIQNSVSISTMTGQIVKTETFDERKHFFDISVLEAGIYVVKVIQGSNTVTQIISKY